MSRKCTARADSAIPTPVQNSSRKTSGIGTNSSFQVSGTRVTSITIRIAARLKLMVTKLDSTRDTGNMYFGM